MNPSRRRRKFRATRGLRVDADRCDRNPAKNGEVFSDTSEWIVGHSEIAGSAHRAGATALIPVIGSYSLRHRPFLRVARHRRGQWAGASEWSVNAWATREDLWRLRSFGSYVKG